MRVEASTIDLMGHMLSAATRRHEVVSANLANMNVPNYKARVFEFEDDFRSALAKGGPDAAMRVQGSVHTDETSAVKADGNSVHLGHELGVMQKNQLLHGFYTTALQHQVQTMRRAITGRA
ncbi:MAG: flagellar basal body rod protein FlgB [Planctomycetes bacterium]|nr:flagellar basal body rod protein FlgB [Planctomycetota bacterium]